MSQWLVIFLLPIFLPFISSHGRLVQPPGRSTAWRYGFKTPTNYNDHELFCGGFTKQWSTNKGKCGLCGDSWDKPRPRANEHGGLYGKGVIVAEYHEGEIFKIKVKLTANHRGFFEFRLCPHNSLKKSIPENPFCFEKYLLSSTDGHDRYAVSSGISEFDLSYRLPKGLTCSQCVLQWRYVAGNNWNQCGNGTGKVGCGPQEEFRSCADIRITDNDGNYDDTHSEYDNTIGEDSPTRPIVDPYATSTKPKYDDEGDSDENLEDSITFLEPTTHSQPDQTIAIVVTIILSLLLLLIILAIYLWKRKYSTIRKLKLKENWWPAFLRPSSLDTLKTSPVPPIPPPRMRRNNVTFPNRVQSSAINISSPTTVTVNGLPVYAAKPKLKIAPILSKPV